MHKITINYGDYLGTKKVTLFKLKTFKLLKWSFTWWDFEDQYRGVYSMIGIQIEAWKELYHVEDEMIFDYTLKTENI